MQHSRYEVLLAFCNVMQWSQNSETIYQRIVDASAGYLECDSAHLHLIDTDGKRFVRHASHDGSLENWSAEMPVTTNLGRMAQLMNDGKLIVMEDYASPHEDDVIPDFAIEAGYKSAISIPLESPSGILGMLSIVYKRDLPWNDADHGFLLEIGGVLGTFIQRVQNSKKEIELQLLRERKQLSSEIHDNISQMVSALAIRADIASSCLEDGDVDDLESELKAISEQARQVTKVLREEMLSLRAPIEGAGDVVDDLQAIVERFQNQWSIAVEFDRSGVEHAVVSEYARLQLVRIVNECLQNVLRHSRATAVTVRLERRNSFVIVFVRDNGIGFDVQSVAPERLGIRIMRERAASAGGEVFVESNGEGTTVSVRMPIAKV